MHGDLDRPESIILGSRSYNNLLYQSPNYLSFLETLFTTQTVLFIGFGGSDPDFDYLIDRLSTIFSRTLNKHFMLVADDKFNFTEKRRLLIDKRLETIEYDPKNNHEQVGVFIKKLADAINDDKIKTTPQKELPTYVFVISQDLGEEGIVQYVDSLKGFHVSAWHNLDMYFNAEIKKDAEHDIFDENYDFKPSLALIEISEKSLKSVSFEKEVEQALLKELEEKITIVPVVIGNIEVPFKLRNFQHVRLPEDYKKKDLEEIKRILTVYNNK